MRFRECFLRSVILITLLVAGYVDNQPAQKSRAAGANMRPEGISPAAWNEILSQVQADVQSTAADPLLTTAVKKLTALDGASSDNYGISVGVSGDTAVIGAYNATVGGNLQRGAAYIYQRNRGGGPDYWGIVTKLSAFDGLAYDYFGVSVAISGDTVVVGAMGADVGGNSNQGAAYVYRRNAGGADQWGLMKKLVAVDGAAYDYFGGAVTVSGWMLAVGADSADISGRSSQGAVYVYYRNQGGMDQWGQWKKVTASDGAANNYFGGALAMSNDTLVVGAWGADVSGILGQGVTYVFTRNKNGADQWGEVKKLVAADGAAYDRFGYAVAINGTADKVVVGAYQADVDGASNRGAAYVFTRNQGGSADNWGQVQKLAASDGAASDQFGRSVAVSQNRILVGAIGDDANQGGVYRYEVNQGGLNQWGQVEKLVAWDGAGNDNLGTSVSLNETGDIAILGAPGDESWRGAGYVFSWQGVNWSGQRELSDCCEGDRFSNSVALSGDTLVVGSERADFGGQRDAGIAYVFSRNWGGAENWGLVKKLNASDYGEDDHFGFSVAISDHTLVVGAERAEIAGQDSAGAAYVFSRNWGGVDNWGEVKKVIASDNSTANYFGTSVAIKDYILVVGAPRTYIGGQVSAGAAYVFYRNQGGVENWGEVKKLFANDYASYDFFGNSVAIDGDTLVVGARYANIGGEESAGAVYIFSHNWGGMDYWGQVKKLYDSDFASYDYFGYSLSLNGDTLVVGELSQVIGGERANGAVYIFYRNFGGTENWGQVKKLFICDCLGFVFGSSVAISGDTLMAGANRADIGGLVDAGEAYVFSRNFGGMDQWGMVTRITAIHPVEGAEFSSSIAIDGSTSVVGAIGSDKAYVFQEVSTALFLPLVVR